MKNKSIFSKPNSRKTRWSLKDNYLQFWFRFIYANQSLIEVGRLDLLREVVESGYDQFSGLLLEKYFREKIFLEERVTEIGSYWDGKGENEIDVVALNRLDKTAIIAEVKRNPKKIDLAKLTVKVQSLKKDIMPYQYSLKGLSLEDM